MLRVPLHARQYLLDLLIAGLDIYIHLYTGDTQLDWCTKREDLHESTAPGYSAQHALGWTSSVIVGNRARTQADPVLFTRLSSGVQEQVYGYFATDGTGGELLWAERGPHPPYPFAVAADAILIVPRFTLRGEGGLTPEPDLPVCGHVFTEETGSHV